jgi:recombination associated protein RdgC
VWFKNLVLFRLPESFQMEPEALGELLKAEAFKACGGLQPFSQGFSPPLGRLGTELVHSANGYTLICVRREERVLPPAVVREQVEDRIARVESMEGREVRSKERRRMRDEVTFELMPRAFTRSSHTFAYIAPREGWLVVDAVSEKKAEDLLVLFGHAVKGFTVEPFEAERSPAAMLTNWIGGERLPSGFELGDQCELRDPALEGALVRCQRQDLTAAEVRSHLKAGKVAHQVALTFDARISFVLGADLGIRRLKFEAVDEFDELDETDPLARFDANFAFMTAELSRLLKALDAVFTGA